MKCPPELIRCLPASSLRLEISVHFLAPELGRPFRAPDVGQLVPVASLPLVADAVHVGVVLDPTAPRVANIVEEVRGERVPAGAKALLESRIAHAPYAEADVVDAGDLEAGVLESPMGAGNEPEAMMVDDAVARRHERNLAFRPVAGAQAQHVGEELLGALVVGGEHQRVPETKGPRIAVERAPVVLVDSGS